MRVLKFGGTSVAHAENIDRAASIVEQASWQGRVAVVVSALAGVTNALQAAIDQSVAGTPPPLYVELAARHLACATAISPSGMGGYRRRLGRTLAALRRLLEGAALLGECPPATRDRILATGERLAAPLLTLALRRRGLRARCHDGSSLIATGPPGNAGVDFPATRRRAREILGARPRGEVAVVTGFVAGDEAGRTTTLGRGASDLSATLLAAAAGADRVEIWTDVDGVLSAEPRLVPQAFVLPHLTYGEAADLACLGARVLHPECLQPLVAPGIALFIRNTLRPELPGTRVDGESCSSPGVRAVTALPVVRFLCRDGGRGAALSDLDRLDQPPLLAAWEAPGRALSVVVPEAAESQAAEALARSAGPPVERFELALVAVVDGSGDLLSATAPAVLAALAANGIGVRGLFQPAAAPRTLAVLIDRQALPSAVRLLHRELVAAIPRHSGDAGREAPAGQLWAPLHGSASPRGPVRSVAGS